MNRVQYSDGQLTALDLFSGAGGTTEGLKSAGYTVLGAIELDPLAASCYSGNHAETKLWRTDIRSLPAMRVARALDLSRGELDLLVACPPCQAYSRLRKLNGARQVRDKSGKDLSLEVVRFAKALRPKFVMIENVPGLAGDPRFKQIESELGGVSVAV